MQPSFGIALKSPRVWALLFLGFASGLPFALVGSTLSAWFTQSGISLMGIGLLSLVGQPYIYKFFWAPLMDRYIPPFLGRRRGWIVLMQIGMIIALALIAFLNPQGSAKLMALLALLIAFFSASQDTAIGGYLVDAPLEHERGLAAAAQSIGYRLAMVISGGIALILAQHYGWRITYLIMSACMLLGTIATLLCPEPQVSEKTAPQSLKQAVFSPFIAFCQRYGAWATFVLLFTVVFYKLGDALTVSLNTTFLYRYLHFSLEQIGIAYKLMSIIASLLGGIIGGLLMTRMSLFKSLVYFGILQALSNLTYMWLAAVGHHFALMVFAVFTEYFCGGLSTVAFTALLMTICDKRFSATQYALLSAFASVGRVYVGPIAAEMITHLGWTWFYFWSTIIALPGVALLFAIRKHMNPGTTQPKE